MHGSLLVTRQDANGDGLPPLLLRNRLGESGDFSDVSSTAGIELPSDTGVLSQAVAWGDYDRDGDLDLFVGDERSTNASSRFYVNNLPLSRDFTEDAAGVLGASPSDISSATWFDVDHNGDPDLLTGLDWPFSQSGLWANAGGTLTTAGVPGECPCLGLVPVDYDYDGSVELLTLPSAAPRAIVASRVVPDATGSFVLRQLSGSQDLQKSGPVDYLLTEDLGGAAGNRDGDLDMLLGKTKSTADSGPPDLLLQNFFADADTVIGSIDAVDKAPINHWVGVVLVGGGGNNKMGIGAKVECTYTDPVLEGVTQTQWVDGGSLRGSQRSQVLRFGLGAFDGDVSLAVTWPDGWVQTVSAGSLNLDQVNVIQDNTIPGLREATQAAAKTFLENGDVQWTFTWETNFASKRGISGVEVAGDDPACGLPGTGNPMFLSSFDTDVQYTMEAILGTAQSGIGGYQHTLVWTQSCTPGCKLFYRMVVQQDFSPVEVSSSWTTVKTKICPSYQGGE